MLGKIKVKGKWTFNDVLIDPNNNIYQDVNFSTDGKNWDGGNSWNGILIGDTGAAPFRVVAFWYFYGGYTNEQDVYSLEEYDGGIIQPGWYDESYKTIDFGETGEDVDEIFYAWLTENAVQVVENIKIDVTENGTTTLATAGMYCDRDIDVNVNVAGGEEEIARQKAITDSIVDKTITEFSSDNVATIELYAFYYCRSLHTVNCPNVWVIYTRGFGNCAALKRIKLPRVSTIAASAFADSSLETLILSATDYTCSLQNTNAFSGTPIGNGTGYIYVPDGLVETYKTLTNWSNFASQIFPYVLTVADLANVDGTIYPRCWVDETDSAYTYDGTQWVEVA